ncbi:MAG: thioredoxin family protein [Pontiellaceae bacterium]|nr:thioredoxin family protein [Pontiellaceae bacterium]
MKINRRSLSVIIIGVAAFAVFQQAKRRYDYSAGMQILQTELKQAKEEDKHVLLLFTGSDWCQWCVKMDQEVLSSPIFKAYADEALVIVECDIPKDKSGQSEALQARNRKLKNAFSVKSFPTLLFLDSFGKVVEYQEGYQEGGAEAYVARLRKKFDSP